MYLIYTLKEILDYYEIDYKLDNEKCIVLTKRLIGEACDKIGVGEFTIRRWHKGENVRRKYFKKKEN